MKSSSKHLTLAFAVAASLGIVSHSNAAPVVTWDLRLAGSPLKLIEITQPSQVVNLEVWGQVVNNDGNRANDGVQSTSLRFLSNEGVIPLLGNYSNAVKDNFYTLGLVGTANAALDGNPDSEWGTNSGSNNTGNFNPSAIGTKFGSGSGSGLTEIFIGTIVWTGPAVLVPGATTNLTLGYFRNSTTGNGNFGATTDGVAFTGTSAGGVNANAAINSDPIGLFIQEVPEPASLGLMAVGGLALLARRRKA